MEKFKVGDRIEFYGGRWNGKPGIVRAVDYSSPKFQLLLKLVGEPEAWYGAQYVKHASNTITSKNPDVQNALEPTVSNVKAYDGYGRSIKVGDEVDTNKGLARVVQIKNRNDGSIHGVASYIGLSYKPNSNAVDEWIRCRTDGSAHVVMV